MRAFAFPSLAFCPQANAVFCDWAAAGLSVGTEGGSDGGEGGGEGDAVFGEEEWKKQ